jgi:hypothetical protein
MWWVCHCDRTVQSAELANSGLPTNHLADKRGQGTSRADEAMDLMRTNSRHLRIGSWKSVAAACRVKVRMGP